MLLHEFPPSVLGRVSLRALEAHLSERHRQVARVQEDLVLECADEGVTHAPHHEIGAHLLADEQTPCPALARATCAVAGEEGLVAARLADDRPLLNALFRSEAL